MDGMSMLLKAAGFDADGFQAFIGGMKEYMVKINHDLDVLREQQQTILQLLERLNGRNQTDQIGIADDHRSEAGRGNGTESGA